MKIPLRKNNISTIQYSDYRLFIIYFSTTHEWLRSTCMQYYTISLIATIVLCTNITVKTLYTDYGHYRHAHGLSQHFPNHEGNSYMCPTENHHTLTANMWFHVSNISNYSAWNSLHHTAHTNFSEERLF